MTEKLEQQLDSFNRVERRDALSELCEQVKAGDIVLPESGSFTNMHFHTFFSFNYKGYSPSKIAWLARKAGLAVVGTVDFDVLDALDEFHEAGKMLGLKTCSGMETRVFLPEFASKEINSPGEPGIAYHMGVGFASANLQGSQADFQLGLRQTVKQRNSGLIERVNKYLTPIELDYEKDVVVLTPSGNATERHIILAYARKAQEVFSDTNKLEEFWSEKLNVDAKELELPEGRDLLNTIRARTMKRGGVGYVQPGEGSFPLMAEFNNFCLQSGAIPTAAWLNGLSDGEKAIEELLEVGMKIGNVAFNIIPDRNFTPGVKDEKLENLCHVIELANSMDMPIIVGTEMNSPGQKFVDDFASAELAPFLPVFLKGAHIVYGHSVMQQQCGLGYTSGWAKKNFATVADKNEFFRQLGETVEPNSQDRLAGLSEETSPEEILNKKKKER